MSVWGLPLNIATYPNAGDVVSRSGGCRKLRWRSKNSGKRGGYRVIYYNRLTVGETYLLLIYAKAKSENIPAHLLNKIRQELENE